MDEPTESVPRVRKRYDSGRSAPGIRDRVVEIVHHLEHVISLALGLITRTRESTLLELELRVQRRQLRVQRGQLRLEALNLPGHECIDGVPSLHLLVEGCAEI